MSFKAIQWAARQTGMKASEKAVLVALAFHFNDRTHLCFPSWNAIAMFTQLERTTVWRAVGALESEHGLIIVEPRRDGGRQTSHNYYLPDYDAMSNPARPRFDDAA